MTTKFRAYTEDELPNIEFRSTKEEALADAVARAVADGAMMLPHPPNIVVEEVREAFLTDFFDAGQLVSMMRESMQEMIGNDDALSEPSKLIAELQSEIEPIIMHAANMAGIRIDGYITISKYTSRDWHGKLDDIEA